MDKDIVNKLFASIDIEKRIEDQLRYIVKYGPYDYEYFNSCYDCAGSGCDRCNFTGEGT